MVPFKNILIAVCGYLLLHPTVAFAALQAAARVDLGVSGLANATDAERGIYTANASAESHELIPYIYPPELRGTGSASVNGASTDSFLRSTVEIFSNSQDFQMAGASQADWQDIIRVSGPAPAVIYLTVGVDVRITFTDIFGPSLVQAGIELNMGQIAGPFAALFDIQYFPPYIISPDDSHAAAFGGNQFDGMGVWPDFWSSYSFFQDLLAPNVIEFHGEHALALNKTAGVAGADGYAYFADLRVKGRVYGGDLIVDAAHSASIVSITDAFGNDLNSRVTFDSGMQFPSSTTATSEPASLTMWSLSALAAMSRAIKRFGGTSKRASKRRGGWG